MTKTINTVNELADLMERIIDDIVLHYPLFGKVDAPSVFIRSSIVGINNGIDGIPLSLSIDIDNDIIVKLPVIVYEDKLLKTTLEKNLGKTQEEIKRYMTKVILAMFKYIMVNTINKEM